ncbi:MAG: Mur ligase [Lysobacter sp.]|nr:Mur ligase [Lysobacter sp.]
MTALAQDEAAPAFEFPFEDSRRLTGANLYFGAPGVALETRGGPPDSKMLARWRYNVANMRDMLMRSQDDEVVVREHASGASLAFVAPIDGLYAATEINEWAWSEAAGPIQQDVLPPHAPGYAAYWDRESALYTLRALAWSEVRPDMVGLIEQAQARGVRAYSDDDALSIGEGAGSAVWPLGALPRPVDVPWHRLHSIPKAVVTGSNGKTTSVRLLAAMARAQGWHTAHSSTDGLYVDGECIDGGDYSGPVGARTLLRRTDVEAAILETARGGLLRRGITPEAVRVALVTNISPDHFGEYGIHTLDDLAEVKLTVARSLAEDGLLVLNADDELLVRHSAALFERFGWYQFGWFALDDEHPVLRAHRNQDGATCAARDGRLHLHYQGRDHDLGEVAAMPLTLGGRALYNQANLSGAALAAAVLGVAPERIAQVLARFGSAAADNPGRLQRWVYGDSEVYLDYAHNPDGLRKLLEVAARPGRRLGLLLGQAGNREDRDIRELAAVAAEFRPDRVVLKDLEGYMRGRAQGEVAAVLADELRRRGLPETALAVCLDEVEAATGLLRWAAPGDVLVLPVHNAQAREAMLVLLDRLQLGQWRPGRPLTGDVEMKE